MAESTRVLFVTGEIFPYLPEETVVRKLNRKLPELCQFNGMETRTFMPKFGEINERRNQLHEVIRLSGMNISIDDADHPILLKVASIQSARIQIYFIDNDDFFNRRRGVRDAEGKWWNDNDERAIFFARAVLETIKKLRWMPDIVYCSGWFSALTPLYVKKAFADIPIFSHAKVVFALDSELNDQVFGTRFAEKLLLKGIRKEDVAEVQKDSVTHADLIRLAIHYSDAVVVTEPSENAQFVQYAEHLGKPILPYEDADESRYLDFFKKMLIE